MSYACVCCEVAYDDFDFLDTTTTIHKGVAAMNLQELKHKSTFFEIGDSKRMYFYNNTLTTFHVVLVRSITDELSEAYSPAIRLEVSTISQPVPLFIWKPCEYMCVKTVKKNRIQIFSNHILLIFTFFI
jgi:hypothetical protein